MRFWWIRAGSIAVALGFCFLLDLAAHGQSDYVQLLIAVAGLYVTLAVSLNLINGITGQFSIGHAAFYQIGAYTTGFLASKFAQDSKLPMSPGLWLLVMMVVSAIAASIAGLIVGLPSLRLRGDYLAIVTLGFGEIIRIVTQNQPVLGGSYGMNVAPKLQYIWISWMLAITCIAVCRNLLKTAHGLPFLAVREDEVASAAMGVNVTKVKVVSFLIGSAFAGAAGALYAHLLGFISPTLFSMDLSFILVTMVVLGGTGSITGSVLSAAVLFYIPEKMRDLSDVRLATLLGVAIALGCVVAAIRYVTHNIHGSKPKRAAYYVGALVGGVVLAALLGALFGIVPALHATVEGAKLRLVVFAATLIVLMLIRPQGVFAHHEFSWSWVLKLLGSRKEPSTEIAA